MESRPFSDMLRVPTKPVALSSIAEEDEDDLTLEDDAVVPGGNAQSMETFPDDVEEPFNGSLSEMLCASEHFKNQLAFLRSALTPLLEEEMSEV
eukprot:m.222153 g.222153  ORF g.222153 m.222153 type:complete len:94 (-) comp10727_c0_seq1:531-812(-)